MAIAAHKLTTKSDIVKPLQYIGEGDTYATPANFGTTPASSTFIIPGYNTEINIQPDIQHVDLDPLGTEDLTGRALTQELHTFSLKTNPVDLVLWKYLWDGASPGGTGGTVSPDESLSFTWSEYLDGTEYYYHIRGARPTSGTLTFDRGLVEQEMTFICKDITAPSTTDGNATATYDTDQSDTGAALTHASSSGSPFTWNSNSYAERRTVISCSRDMSVLAPNGQTDILYCRPTTRRVSVTTDVFTGTYASDPTELYDDFEAKTDSRTASYKVDGTYTLTMSNCIITNWSRAISSGNSDANIETITFRPESVTDLA